VGSIQGTDWKPGCQMVYIFSTQKSKFGYILEGLGMEDVGIPTYFQTKNPICGKFWRVLELKMLAYIFYGHLVYFTAIWYIIRSFCIFFTFWYVVARKI
jgi:hypothetical protein